MKTRFIAALAIVVTVVPLLAVDEGSAALPVGYGGVVRWPASTALRIPDTRAPRTAFEAALARSIFDGLYDVDESLRPVPVLAESLPAREGERFTVRLREGLTLHDRRPLTAQRVLEALETSTSFWLAGLRRPDGSLDIEATGPRTLSIGASRTTRPSRVLAATPLSIRLGSAGTGSFRARMREGKLELRGFRGAARGAPYLDRVLLTAPRARGDALREFELQRIDGSWFGARLYGGEEETTESVTVTRAPLMIVAKRSGPALAILARSVDRRRLARVGLAPTDRLAPELPPPGLGGTSATGAATIVIAIDRGDPLMARVVEALRAQLDERGVRLRVGPASRADVSLVSVVPGLPGNVALLATAFDLAGDRGAAEALASGNLAGTGHAARRASSLSALVLGVRQETLHYRRARAVRRDDHDHVLMREIHVSRSASGESR